jgi:hypothetical protein
MMLEGLTALSKIIRKWAVLISRSPGSGSQNVVLHRLDDMLPSSDVNVGAAWVKSTECRRITSMRSASRMPTSGTTLSAGISHAVRDRSEQFGFALRAIGFAG